MLLSPSVEEPPTKSLGCRKVFFFSLLAVITRTGKTGRRQVRYPCHVGPNTKAGFSLIVQGASISGTKRYECALKPGQSILLSLQHAQA
jgi:hypothetical protein